MVDLLTTQSSDWDVAPVLEVWVHKDNRPAVVALAGRLDAATGSQVRALLSGLIDDGHCDVIVDLSRVESCDDEGVGILVNAHAAGGHRAGNIVLYPMAFLSIT